MPIIRLQTIINASAEVVFDLARSIDLHTISTAHTNEKAVAGKTSGLIEIDESVTWQATHFGIKQLLTSKITAMEKPRCFTDEMVTGAFARFKHEHIFTREKDITVMTDVFDYTSPYGIFGKIADLLFLKKYMTNLLLERNCIIKEYAENENKLHEVVNLNNRS